VARCLIACHCEERMRLRGTAEANWKGFLASLFAEPVLSGEILPLHFVQGQNDKGSEGLRASTRNKFRNLRMRLPRLRRAMTRPLPSNGRGWRGPPLDCHCEERERRSNPLLGCSFFWDCFALLAMTRPLPSNGMWWEGLLSRRPKTL